MSKRWFSITTIKPALPRGNVIIDYNPEEDLLLIALATSDPKEDEEISIAKSEMRIEREKNIVITINRSPEKPPFISSIALTRASEHPLFADLFRGLEVALREEKMMNFSVDPSLWDLR